MQTAELMVKLGHESINNSEMIDDNVNKHFWMTMYTAAVMSSFLAILEPFVCLHERALFMPLRNYIE